MTYMVCLVAFAVAALTACSDDDSNDGGFDESAAAEAVRRQNPRWSDERVGDMVDAFGGLCTTDFNLEVFQGLDDSGRLILSASCPDRYRNYRIADLEDRVTRLERAQRAGGTG